MYENDRRLQILIPGGELTSDVTGYLQKVGMDFRFDNPEGSTYLTSIQNMPVDLLIIRASSIPIELEDERCMAKGGITGGDILWESGWGKEAGRELNIGKMVQKPKTSSLYIGINGNLIDRSINSLATPSLLDKLRNGIIATKYPNIAREYFEDKGINDVEIKYAPGKDEAYQYMYRTVNGVLGIWSTGSTARTNNIVPVDKFYDVAVRLVQASSNRMSSWETDLFNDFYEKCYIAEQK